VLQAPTLPRTPETKNGALGPVRHRF
jgi:hypothetical protein